MSLQKNPRYDLKGKYKRIFNTSIIVSLFVVIAAFKYAPKYSAAKPYKEQPPVVVEPADVDITIQNKPPPLPPRPLTLIEAPGDPDIPDVPIDDNNLNPDADASKDVKPYVDKDPEPNDPYFIVVEQDPYPIGGLAAITAKLEYPALAIRARIEGEVLVRAYVDEDGRVAKVELLKSIGGGCDEAALEAVMKTKFNPGRQRGKAVKVMITVPVRFILK